MRRALWLAAALAALGAAPAARDFVAGRLRAHETLDFEVFNRRLWERLGESHAPDVVVVWPDGRESKGLPAHLEDLKAFVAPTPDLRIAAHPVKFGSGEWTLVVGEMRGSFTRPLPAAEGRLIQPNGRSVALRLAVVSRWKDGRIARKYLFWDQGEYRRQLGLAP